MKDAATLRPSGRVTDGDGFSCSPPRGPVRRRNQDMGHHLSPSQ